MVKLQKTGAWQSESANKKKMKYYRIRWVPNEIQYTCPSNFPSTSKTATPSLLRVNPILVTLNPYEERDIAMTTLKIGEASTRSMN